MTDTIRDFVHACRRDLRGEVRADRVTRALYATDASSYQIEPLAVVLPRDRDDIAAAMTHAARLGLPVLPRGGGSSLAGQAVGAAVVIDTTKYMHGLLALDAEARRARVQPGMTLQALNDRLARHGLKFGPDPASAVVCTAGGIVGNNSTGAHSILYRMTADHLHALEVVLSDGTPARFAPTPRRQIAAHVMRGGLLGAIWQRVPAIVARARPALDARRPATWRRCGGYNLDRLLDADPINLAELVCGSEGTLAAITEVELKLVPLPKESAVVLAAFDDQHAALEAVPAMLTSDPSAVEHIDRYLMRMQREAGGDYSIANFIGADDPEAVLIVEFYGDTRAEVLAKIERLEGILAVHGGACRTYRFLEPAAQRAVWLMRKAQAGLLMRLRGDVKPINVIEDVAVPVEHLAAYVRDVTRVCAELGAPVTMGAHASAGCLHVMPFVDLKRADGVETMRRISAAAADLVLHYKGAMSSEHGDGLARSWLNRHIFGDEIYEAFRQVKAAFDPDNRMNPGKVVDGPPMTEHLRYGEGYATIPLVTQFDWSADGGFAGAVEVCNGQGYCRKVEGGTLCPSYMVTRDERDSTRGRANALRNALSGRLPREALFGPELHGVLDLCVGCKACQSECPSSVDMARIRSEFLYHYHREHGASLRTRAFAHMPQLSRLVTRSPLVARLANAALGAPPLAALIARTLGITPAHPLPPFATQTFSAWRKQEASSGGALTVERSSVQAFNAPPVVLFADTWAEHHEPGVARAAYRVLRAAGFAVIVPEYTCCGRTLLSKGFLPQAKLAAERVFERLAPYIEQEIPVVGLEPSCVLAFRDEYLTLTRHPRRAALARLALTFEEFVARNADRIRPALVPAEGRGKLLLHGHCHQKAQVGTGPARQALALAGYEVCEVDSGCCGMAGSFGYEREHAAVSRAMAERALLPAVRACDPDTTIAAAGVSCRHQIAGLAGRRALHPAEALAARLRA
ncbi:MAG TPA: FAD-linked oxidase C-terminal domain-containing protein [Roseiflexaceae bacterium]|nr:FAD-linked oxidase C-terminal domain-containing protein [Roseiflexaceae bacterium]